ncbi:hypothetical protein OpiT1DRAFT_05596 [Opitutaceae bacterium TAV1]|nr:hypothetical protein OpiT1DRAFT_05596 [Opitutaceae bacterium TAV1]
MTDKVNTQEVTGKIEEIDSGIALKISEYKKGA